MISFLPPGKILPALLAAAALGTSAHLGAQVPSPTPTPDPAITALTDIHVVLHTDKGDVAVTLFPSKAPLTVANFLNLANRKYYDNVKFHRVIRGFVTQGGDPTGTGSGTPGYEFKDEIAPDLKFDKPGVLAMALHGQNTNGSQFFITHAPTPWLNGKFTIFGQVTQGQDAVENMTQSDALKSIDVLDPTGPLFGVEAKQLAEWNAELDKNKPRVSPAP